MNSTRTATSIVLALLAAFALTSCATPEGSGNPGPVNPSPSENGTSNAVFAACGGMSTVVTALTGAEQLRYDGQFTDEDVALTTRIASTQLRSIAAQPGIGLKPELETLIAAESDVPPPAVGAAFDPDRPEFASALAVIRDACAANGTPLISWSAIAGG